MVSLLGWGAAFAAAQEEVAVLGRGYTDACGYYHRTEADFEILHRNPALPWGTRVFVIYGFGTDDGDWLDREEAEAKSVGPALWGAKISKTLHFRSRTDRVESMQFVLRVRLPGGEEYYIKGSESLLGFMEARFKFVGNSPCLVRNSAKPNLSSIVVRTVDRG